VSGLVVADARREPPTLSRFLKGVLRAFHTASGAF
jgi:hypothetical protein